MDDDAQVRTVAQMLEKLRLQVIAASDRVEAVGCSAPGRRSSACVLLDLMMPRLHPGRARVIREIAGDARDLMSGYSDEETAQRFVGGNRLWFLQSRSRSRPSPTFFANSCPTRILAERHLVSSKRRQRQAFPAPGHPGRAGIGCDRIDADAFQDGTHIFAWLEGLCRSTKK